MAAGTSCLASSPRLTTLAASSRRPGWHPRRPAVHRCAAAVDGRKTTVQSKAGDALEVCRVVNGMWQVSGASWGLAQPAAAVDAMLRYADGGLTTFDMADICKEFQIIVRPRVSRCGCGSGSQMPTFARIHFLIPVHLRPVGLNSFSL